MASTRSQLVFSLADHRLDDDECAGLITALNAAVACKEHLRSSQPSEALVCFTKALAHSVHCVECLQEVVPALVEAAELIELDKSWIFAQLGKPLVLHASTLLLIGQNLQDLPSPQEAMKILQPKTGFDPAWHMLAEQLDLKTTDICWVINLGGFKTALRMVSQKGYLQNSVDKRDCQSHLQDAVHQLYHSRPSHPATQEAISLFYQHRNEDPIPIDDVMQNLNHTMCAALSIYHDPAAAMHHLLHTMYIILMDCFGKPNSKTKSSLWLMATHWHAFSSVLRSRNVHPHGNLWKQIDDKMACALLLLGRAFPLNDCLNGHPFSHFVQRVHHIVHNRSESLSQQETSGSEEDEDPLQESKEEVVRSYRNSPALCSRCKKGFNKSTASSTCPSCNSVYCSLYCQEKDYVCHRAACKRRQLRDKLQKRHRCI
ncbi:hypothetical protein ABBQ38_000529 [Trebouxia sp. C0009 RCD-2024]